VSPLFPLAPQILPQDALINKSAEEIEKLALEEAEKMSPKYARGKEIKRNSNYRFLKGFTITIKGRRKIYKPQYITVRLPILYKEGKRIKTSIEEELEKESDKVLKYLLISHSVIYGKLN
jgi:putative transposase